MPQAIGWKDCNSVYLGCNQQLAVMAGVETPSQIIGKTDYDLAWNQFEADFFRAWDASVIDSNQAKLHVLKSRQREGGKLTWLDISNIPLHNREKKIIGLLTVIEDVTERKAATEALQASESLLKQKAQQLKQHF